jgi:hypothetical protein
MRASGTVRPVLGTIYMEAGINVNPRICRGWHGQPRNGTVFLLPDSGGSKTHANIIANPQFVAIDLQTDAKIAQIKGLANHILFTCTCVVT